MRQAIIVDIDGTVARRSLCCPSDVKLEDKSHGHRNIHAYDRVIEDAPNEAICDIVRTYSNLGDVDILFTSGRPNSCREATLAWLQGQGLWFDSSRQALIMRKTGDYRKDDIVKKELYDALIKPHYDILF